MQFETNRRFMLKIYVPLVIINTIVVVTSLLFYLLGNFVIGLLLVIIFGVIDVIFIIGLITSYKERVVKFNSEEITYTEKKEEVIILLSNIVNIKYVKMPWWYYIIGVMFFLFGENVFFLPTIEIYEKNNKVHEIGYFTKRDVLKIKEMYGDLVDMKKEV